MHRAVHPLVGEQRFAVFAACSPRAFTVIEGWAGTGKSTTLHTVVDAYLGRGTGTEAVADHVYALACAGLAAQGTAERIGAEAGHTVESFCAAVEHGRIRPTARTVLVVDEYITVDTFRMARLLQAAGEARIICVGDERQAQGIGASGWQLDVRDVLEPVGLGPVTLTNVHRQRDRDDRMALAQLREGRGGQALADLDRRGRLHVAEDPAHVDGQVLATYQRLRDEGRSVRDVFVDTDTCNARVDTYNRLIQHDRLRRGELSAERHLDYVADAPDRHERLYVGDRVAFLAGVRTGDTKVANGAQGEIISIDQARPGRHRPPRCRRADPGPGAPAGPHRADPAGLRRPRRQDPRRRGASGAGGARLCALQPGVGLLSADPRQRADPRLPRPHHPRPRSHRHPGPTLACPRPQVLRHRPGP